MEPIVYSAWEETTIAWAREAFHEPWKELLSILNRLERGERLSRAERRFDPFFLPFSLSALPIHRAMRLGLSRALFGSNPNMFTFVLNSEMHRPVFAAAEKTENGVYTEMHLFNDRLDEAWAMEAARFIRENRLEEAYRLLKVWVAEQSETKDLEIGLVKIATLDFFDAFKRAWFRSRDGRLISFSAWALEAVHEVEEKGFLRFYPEVNLARAIRLISPLLGLMRNPLRTVGVAARFLPF